MISKSLHLLTRQSSSILVSFRENDILAGTCKIMYITGLLIGCHLTNTSISDNTVYFSGYLVFDVWDHDAINPDDFLGRVMVPLREIAPGDSREKLYPLTQKSAKEDVEGFLCARINLTVDPGKVIGREGEKETHYCKRL